MEDMFQALRVRMYLDKPMERPAINQALELSTEVLMNQLTLSINPYLSKNIFIMPRKLTIQLPKLWEFKEHRIHTRK
jgi:hypothetical protein